jgi:CRP-like cAMP-binding protein
MEPREALALAPIFADLEKDVLKSLASSARMRRFAQGELIASEGEDATAFFVLTEGRAEVIRSLGQDDEAVLAQLREGEFFGEMALLDGYPRLASVRATTDCECFVLTRWDFLALVRTSPEVAVAVLRVLSRRLRDRENQLLP